MKTQLKPGQEIIFTCEGLGHFMTDKRMMKNILLNLLSNAIKFSGEGKKIKVCSDNLEHRLSIKVQDEGMGIPAEDIPHLFATFFRGKNVSNIQGTGLGLPIIKRYLDLLKGDIKVESELEKGTTFYVEMTRLGPEDSSL